MVKKSTDNDVKIRVTKLGGGKISIGVHIAASGDVMAQTATCSPCRRWRTNWKHEGLDEVQWPTAVSRCLGNIAPPMNGSTTKTALSRRRHTRMSRHLWTATRRWQL
jgi:hypothetical protein